MTRMAAIWMALMIGVVCILMIAGYDVDRVADHARADVVKLSLADL